MPPPDLPRESYEIRPDDLGLTVTEARPDPLPVPDGDVTQRPAPTFEPGDIVVAADRRNTGEVLVAGDQVLVRFVERQDGTVAERWFQPRELTLRKRAPRANPLCLLSCDDLLALPQPQYLVKGVLNRGDLSVIFGPSSAGKTLGLQEFVWVGRSVAG